ncbi:hypothetical protein ZIOFF_054930 [Zingiber officinale]|uniref:Mitotic-spindle organizing protein 1 n=2 Tax=Zingiber officinale TaxID=94328 RepID=A0A8J5FFN3_ZINOF|nr:hypothetical protein ZIOFF_054930 [Zingiber officinale]
MESAEAARNAKETLELAFQMSNILETGLDRHTLSLLIALCDRGVNPEALATLVREISQRPGPSAPSATATSSASSSRANPRQTSKPFRDMVNASL